MTKVTCKATKGVRKRITTSLKRNPETARKRWKESLKVKRSPNVKDLWYWSSKSTWRYRCWSHRNRL